MPMDALCCERATENTRKEIVNKLLPLLKPYLRDKKNSKETIDLIKGLVSITPEFSPLLDMYVENPVAASHL